MKVLGLYREGSGADYHRVVVPLQNLENVDFVLRDYKSGMDDEEFEGVDVLFYNRVFPFGMAELARLKEKYGFRIVVDLDDYWELPYSHYLYHVWKKEKTSEEMVQNVIFADACFCTTERLAKKIRQELRDDVIVVKNAIPEQGKIEVARDRVHIGYASSGSHLGDLGRLEGVFRRLGSDGEWQKKGHFILGGWEEHSIFRNMESIIKPCKQYTKIDRLPLKNYMAFYDLLDVAIAPLEYSDWASYKSSLKMIEAGMKKIPFLCSGVPPYVDDYEMEGKGVKFCLKTKDWYWEIKELIRDKSRREDMGNQLYEYVNKNYNLVHENQKRQQVFENIL